MAKMIGALMHKTKPLSKKIRAKACKEVLCFTLGLVILQDFIDTTNVIKGIELEGFFENWVIKSKFKFTPKDKKVVWRCLLSNLFIFRQNQKNRKV